MAERDLDGHEAMMPIPEGAAGADLRILVVDDEAEIVDLLSHYLTRRGVDVVQAHDAQQATHAVASDPSIGVVISDLAMPGKDGLLLAEELLTGRHDTDAIEVIIMTGFATTEAAIGAMRARAFDLIRKPIQLAELAATVARAAASSGRRRANARHEAEIRQRMDAADDERKRLAIQLQETQSGLRDTRNKLESVERVRRGILSVVSHELRTPLIPILGFAEIIAASPDLPPNDVHEYATQIHQAGSEMLKLIEVALDVVALQDGGGLGPKAGARFATLAGRVLDQLGGEAQKRGVQVILDGPPDTPVRGDLERVERAVVQLVDNAIKASGPGGAVTLHWMTEGPDHTRIEVLDRGCGIPAEILAGLGSAFLKADTSHRSAWPGAGLGLALATRVASAHGGTLTLGERDGGGSFATLILPQVNRPGLGRDRNQAEERTA